MPRDVIQIRANDERRVQLDAIVEYLRGLGLKPTQADALDFALAAALREIAKNQKPS